jgi:hypothetical protein
MQRMAAREAVSARYMWMLQQCHVRVISTIAASALQTAYRKQPSHNRKTLNTEVVVMMHAFAEF